ncbi:preprotein translocase subunit SecE [Saccharospirillum sp. HFRX-1]|uniref:preprotein translocase subunit SecE n=1 Tax=unclassified Saccharospirillum TaxID=2633430 RepID=UPI000D3C0B8A|nr:preprotein translocase subunit SecE [Saccharospirillum sp. MSK14-1]PTY38374.1 preprotein translocase subunit SecE [Saccharospirillum sp. MSK14-1]
MNAQVESQNTALDAIKWVLVAALVVAVIGGNFYFGDESLLLRVIGVVAGSLVAVGIALTTARGRHVNRLRKEAWTEVRKVVWPTRQETVQTTLVVIGVVLLVALILWGIDSLLGWAVSAVIG